MTNIINPVYLCAQTLKEQKLTMLYIGLFALFLVMMVVDMYASKKYSGGKVLNKILMYFLFVAIVAFIVAYFVMG